MSSRVRWGALLATLVLVTGLAVPSAQAAVVPDGTLVTPGTPFSLAVPAQGSATVRVSAAAGRRIVLRQTAPVSTLMAVGAHNAAGLYLPSSFLSSYNDLGVAPVTDTWIVQVTNFSSAVTLSLVIDLATDTTAPLTLGAPTTATTTVGQDAKYTFAATAGQKLHVDVTALNLTGSSPSAAIMLTRPDGTIVDTLGAQHSDPFQVDADLGQTGTWTLTIDPVGDSTGQVTFTAKKPVDTVVPITAGATKTVTYPGGGVDVRLTFAGKAGQRVTLGVLSSSLTSSRSDGSEPHVRARLFGPDGTERGDIGSAFDRAFLHNPDLTLDAAGTWTLLLDAVSDTTGTQTVKLGLITDVAAKIKLGQAYSGSLAAPGQRVSLSFDATAGKKLVLQLANVKLSAGSWGGDPASAGPAATLYGPDGWYQGTFFDFGATFGEFTAPETGTYKLVLSGVQDTVGSATLSVRYPAEPTAALPLGRATTVRIALGDTARYTFTGVEGSRLTFSFSGQSVTPAGGATRVIVRRPDGTLFWQDLVSSADGWFETEPLPAAGQWSVVLDPEDSTAGSLTFTPRLTADQKAALTPGTAVTARIATGGQQARYTFPGVKGRRITLDSTLIDWKSPSDPTPSNTANLSLIRPDGSSAGQFYPGRGYGTAGAELAEFEGNGGLLDTTGTWTLVVDPGRDAVGSQAFTLNLVTDVTGTLTRGQAKKATLSAKGQRAVYTFTWDGQGALPYAVTGSTIADGSLALITPSAYTIDGRSFAAGNTTGELFGNGETGTWTLVVDPAVAATGSATVKIG